MSPSIEVNYSAFRVDDETDEFHGETVIVEGEQDHLILNALEAAAVRYMSVAGDGGEYSRAQIRFMESNSQLDDISTPNWVSPVTQGADG